MVTLVPPTACTDIRNCRDVSESWALLGTLRACGREVNELLTFEGGGDR
jgi:hypothetical protein